MEDSSAAHKAWYNQDKVDEVVLALLWLAASHRREDEPCSANPGTDPEVLRRLEARGLVIPSPRTGSATLSDEGRRCSERLFDKLFGSPIPAALPHQSAGQQVEDEDGE
jgi:hypothetical protein